MATLINSDTQYIDQSTGELINNGFIYVGLDGLDAKLNPATIYSDRALTVPLANPQRTGSDGRSVNKIWVSGKYSLKIENFENVQKLNELSLGELTQTGNTILTNVQGTDALTADASPTIIALVDRQTYILTAVSTNTGAMTLTIDATPTWPVKKHHDNDMQAGDVEANQVLSVIFNDTDKVYELSTNSAIGPMNLANPQTATGVKTFTDGIISNVTGNVIGNVTGNVTGDVTGDLTGDLTGPTSVGGILKLSKGADVASAAALTLGTDGNSFDITGTTTITSIATLGVGTHVTLQFDDILTLTHHATDLILFNDEDIITAAGDVAEFMEYATGDFKLIDYTRLNGAPFGRLPGTIVQVVDVFESTSSSGTTTIPQDDTIPQNTEGDEVMTLSITPQNTSNTLIIDVFLAIIDAAIDENLTAALFQDSTADALIAVAINPGIEDVGAQGTIKYLMAAGTTSSTTFKVRIGATAGTVYFNRLTVGERFGDRSLSRITITEIQG